MSEQETRRIPFTFENMMPKCLRIAQSTDDIPTKNLQEREIDFELSLAYLIHNSNLGQAVLFGWFLGKKEWRKSSKIDLLPETSLVLM